MHKLKLLFVLVTILGIFLAGCSTNNKTTFKSISMGSTEIGDVLIELTPRSIGNSKLEVDISANTHSVDLSQFNLKEITILEINGRKLKPTSASDLTGHHSSGTLVFDLESKANSFVLTLEGIPIEEKRIFEWKED